jgi:hypothetical protein
MLTVCSDPGRQGHKVSCKSFPYINEKAKRGGRCLHLKKHSLQFTAHVHIVSSVERSPFCCITKQSSVAGGDHWPNTMFEYCENLLGIGLDRARSINLQELGINSHNLADLDMPFSGGSLGNSKEDPVRQSIWTGWFYQSFL